MAPRSRKNVEKKRSQSRYSDQQVSARINIISAQYGTESRKVDVTAALRMIVRDGRLEMRVENDTVGQVDPAPGVVKTLWVNYSVNDGRAQNCASARGVTGYACHDKLRFELLLTSLTRSYEQKSTMWFAN